MTDFLEITDPAEIEKKSFEIISSELSRPLPPQLAPIILRVIHTTADFDYAENLCFSDDALESAFSALAPGADIVTDTNMARSGINKALVEQCGARVHCFMADDDVAQRARALGCTRAAVSMDKAAQIGKPLIFAIGNAPTALVRISELYRSGQLVKPALIIGAPVGFVNVVQSKELILNLGVPYIVARGRKGGSGVAAAICNALMKMYRNVHS